MIGYTRRHVRHRGRVARLQGLSNLLSGNSAESGLCILAFLSDVGLGSEGPFFVDFDADGADEAQQYIFAGKDPDFDGAPLTRLAARDHSVELLLDGALDRV